MLVRAYTHTNKPLHSYPPSHEHVHAHAHIYAHVHAYACACVHANGHIHVQEEVKSFIHSDDIVQQKASRTRKEVNLFVPDDILISFVSFFLRSLQLPDFLFSQL